MSLNPIRPWRNVYRRESRQIMVGNVPVGGGAPISVQTMTNTDTRDVAATVAQVQAAADDVTEISIRVVRRERGGVDAPRADQHVVAHGQARAADVVHGACVLNAVLIGA